MVLHQIRDRWLMLLLIAGVFSLEFATPPNYVMGYLYVVPILLASTQLSRRATHQTTALAVTLTILNIWVPGDVPATIPVIVSRLVAVAALVVTGILSERNATYANAIAQQQAQINAQAQLSRMREDFASTLTHDLKTPLLGAIATLKAFEREQFGRVLPTQQPVLSTMIRSHQTSLQFVETLLDVYRIDAEGLKLNLAPVDLMALVEEAIQQMTVIAAARQVHMIVRQENSEFRQALWVNGDRLQLQRVLTNVLMNAINHSRREHRVGIALESQTGYQIIKVSDTGPGIRAEEIGHLFERFYQGTSDRQAKGTGLGLYLARQIITAHGGTIWAENRSPTGAIVGFKLPIYQS